jgi:acetyl esterase/lipase
MIRAWFPSHSWLKAFSIYTFSIFIFFIPYESLMAEELPAIQKQRITLYSGDVPGQLSKGEGHEPHGWLYLPKRDNAKPPISLVVVVPGGGYGGLAMDHEGFQIAQWCNEHGMGALICVYRHRGGGYGHPWPMLDAQRAIRLVRHNARTWHIDPKHIAVIGFSAGGHLTSTLSTHFDLGNPMATDPVEKESCRPDAAILCYPVIGMGKPYTHGGSQRNLLGENPEPELLASLSNEDQVTPQTPPSFLMHTQEDKVVSVENSLAYYSALVKHNVPSSMHLFPKGPHGIGLARKLPEASHWPDLCLAWLKEHGFSIHP